MTGKLSMLVVLGVLPMAGSAGAQAMNQQFDLSGQVFVEPGDPTCPTGTFGTDTFTYDNGFEHITMKPGGTFHVNGTGEGEFEQQPYLDPTVPTCTGHFAFWCGAKWRLMASPCWTTSSPSICTPTVLMVPPLTPTGPASYKWSMACCTRTPAPSPVTD
jgi:hypothetical protein